MIQEWTQEQYRSDANKGIHLVDIYGTHCGPCKMLAFVLEQVERDYPDFSIIKINSDEAKELATELGVRAVPTLLLLEDGEIVKRQTGSMGVEELLNWIGDYIYD